MLCQKSGGSETVLAEKQENTASRDSEGFITSELQTARTLGLHTNNTDFLSVLVPAQNVCGGIPRSVIRDNYLPSTFGKKLAL